MGIALHGEFTPLLLVPALVKFKAVADAAGWQADNFKIRDEIFQGRSFVVESTTQ